MERIRNFFKDESGANMVEYALLLALISVAAVTILTTLGGSVTQTFTDANSHLPQGS